MEFHSISDKFCKSPSSLLPPRRERSNKGDYGRVLCVCGSRGMAGAAYLCAKACYRMGAGLVEIFTHESNRIILQTSLPEAVVTSYGDDIGENALIASVEKADAVVAGCGLGTDACSRNLLSALLRLVDTEKQPLILDADALNLIAKSPSLSKYVRGAVITPHFGEASRLLNCEIRELLADTATTAKKLADKFHAVAVMKDHETVITDGKSPSYVNGSGNSGMATGGSGDVLAGILAGLLVQNAKSDSPLPTLEAAALGVYLHGLAGDIAAEKLGEYSLMASDIIDAIPSALRR